MNWGWIGWPKWPRFIAGSEKPGAISLPHFALIFTLMNHAGMSGMLFVGIWFAAHSALWTQYNIWIFVAILGLFATMAWMASQFSSNISGGKLAFRAPDANFDWLRYARSKVTFLIVIFCLNCSLLLWATGGLASPFIPFYIMVFTLALNYCTFPQPATALTLSFVGFFLFFILLAEIPRVYAIIPVPIDSKMQEAINGLIITKLFDGGFVIASMLVPLISMLIAARRTGEDGLPPAATAVTRAPAEGLAVAAPEKTSAVSKT